MVARDRYLAEDALDLIEVRYEPLSAVMDPGASVLHDGLPGNLASGRRFVTATRKRRSLPRRIASASPCALRVVPARVRRGAVATEALDQHCRASGLANFKRPRRFVFVRGIPKSPVGKLLRRKLVAGEYELADT